ncbi:hypothetical protein [Allobranchiibius huperziae]|uniref:Integral membrane protein n=1 Tax=Allobranchiibius huperziae TaxID=1874116 RepID=A0A853DP93_9MICO|nr:hypothetical protein [Allobranchiibius huperziae]NYJ75955.1 hypothetical protein [Allobranchiibius huperziae]
MKAALVIGCLAAVLLWVWLARRRFQERHLTWLVRRARGDITRARTVTVGAESAALILACGVLALGVLSEQLWAAFYVRIPAAVLVLALYVPYAAMLAPVRTAARLRRSPQQRMVDLGAPAQVADRIARVGRPYAVAGSVVMLAAVYVLFWHHID